MRWPIRKACFLGGVLAAAVGCSAWQMSSGPVRPISWSERSHAQPATPTVVASSPAEAPPAPASQPVNRPVVAAGDATALTLRLQLATGMRVFEFESQNPVHVVSPGSGEQSLAAGRYQLALQAPVAARETVHLFARSFKPGEEAQADAFMAEWRQRGFDPVRIEMGRQYRTESGAVLDNRIYWISMGRFATEAEATSRKAELERERVWSWIRRQRIEPGRAAVASGSVTIAVPSRIETQGPATLMLPQGAQVHEGAIELEVGPDGLLEVYERMPIEDYLAGVLPAEMPASWHLEALKSQAVAARSDVLAHLGLKHHLEGFDYTTDEQNRVYKGIATRTARTDEAVAATRGVIIAEGGRICPAVFSANCGGWTADNETVWSSPPDAALRNRGDFPAGVNPAPGGPAAFGLVRWLSSRPPAYCAHDERNFRWTRTFTTDELSAAVNKRHAVGQVQRVELGDRGPGGRLEWVRIVGARDTVEVRKEYGIRLAFGGLPSAQLILDTQPGPGGLPIYTFTGGGRGHGVGLCQHGAQGMAVSGADYRAIVRHYYTGVAVERVE